MHVPAALDATVLCMKPKKGVEQSVAAEGAGAPPLNRNVRQRERAMSYQIRTIIAGFLIVMISANALAGAAELYVSLDGNDLNPGTKDEPFRTVRRAQEVARHKIAAGLEEPLTVFLREGVYELSGTLRFTPQDSGTPVAPVTYASAPGETAVLSGGRRILGWKAGNDGRWRVNLPQVKEGKWFFRQLTVDGQRAIRSRWPNKDGELRIQSLKNGVKEFTFNKQLPEKIVPGNDAELVIYNNWSIIRGLITDAETRQVTTANAMGWIGLEVTSASRGKPAFVENVQGFIDQPGEWYLSRTTGDLVYFAQKGEDPNKAVVVAPILEQVITIAGTSTEPVRNLHFKRLDFKHTRFPLPSVGYNEIQAAHYGTTTKSRVYVQPVAVECVYAEDCRFEQCRFAHLNSSGIGFGPGCRKNAVIGCTLEDIGGNGVMIGWRGKGKLATCPHFPGTQISADWAAPDDVPVGNEITNCHVTRCGEDSKGAVGIFVAFSADTRIFGNHIHDMPYTGVSIGYRWDTSTTSHIRCIVEQNHIHDVVKVLADGGGIYTLGYQPGTVLRGNHIHDVHRSPFAHGGSPNNGFFLDEGSKGYLLEENVVYATSGQPVRFNGSSRTWHQWNGNFLGGKKPPEDKKAREVIRRAGADTPDRQ